MTDLLDEVLDDEVVLSGPPCAREGCGSSIPGPGQPGYHSMRRYCDAHQPRTSPGAVKRRAKVTPPLDETPPQRVITNNFTVKVPPSPKKAAPSPTAVVEEGAAAMLAFIPMVLAAFGDEQCPPAIAEAIPAIAHQLGVLSAYHPWIKKIFASGENSGEMLAWVGLIIVTSPVVITILAHHNLVSGKLAERLAYVSALGSALAGATQDPSTQDNGDRPA